MKLREMRLGFIGAGNMAGAMLRGFLKTPGADPEKVLVSDVFAPALEKIAETGVGTTADNARVVSESDLTVIAVKPQSLPDALAGLDKVSAGKTFLSIVAGTPVARLAKYLPDAAIIRVMPNTPMLLGVGASGVAMPENIAPELADAAKELLSCTSVVREVREDELDTVTALSGSGPAYFYRIALDMANYAASRGTDFDTAMELVIRTMEGAAAMLRDSGKSPQELIKIVSSPGGTTLAALAAFDEFNLDGALAAGLDACAKRSEELGRA